MHWDLEWYVKGERHSDEGVAYMDMDEGSSDIGTTDLAAAFFEKYPDENTCTVYVGDADLGEDYDRENMPD